MNARREFTGLEALHDLRPCGAIYSDPITGSMPAGTSWVIGQLQYPTANHIVQISPVPDYVHRFLAEWREGAFPEYD